MNQFAQGKNIGPRVGFFSFTYGMWPRLVLVRFNDQLTLFAMVVVICLVASAMGIRRALRVEASAALTG